MQSDAATVDDYLAELPVDRREAVSAVREIILENLPDGFEETMGFGMIAYVVPLETYPGTYNGQPLMYAALASQKNHMAVYLSGIYGNEAARSDFEDRYKATGKRFDVGKSCVRFRRLDDLPLDVVGDAIGRFTPAEFVSMVETAKGRRASDR